MVRDYGLHIARYKLGDKIVRDVWSKYCKLKTIGLDSQGLQIGHCKI